MSVEKSRLNMLAAYGMLLLLIVLLQTTLLSQLRLFGAPLLMLTAATVCVALYEGEVPGALFGVCLGLCVDATVSAHFGSKTLSLLLVGYLAGAASRTIVLRNGLAALTLYAAAHGGLLAADALLRLVVTGSWSGYFAMLADRVFAAAASALFLPLFYYAVRFLHRSFGAAADTELV